MNFPRQTVAESADYANFAKQKAANDRWEHSRTLGGLANDRWEHSQAPGGPANDRWEHYGTANQIFRNERNDHRLVQRLPHPSEQTHHRSHEYTKQTAETRGMLAMLDAEAEAVATLGLTEEVEAVREANAAFDTEFQKKTEEMSARMVQSDVKSEDAVAEANALYEDIVQTVNAYAIVQPTDEINTFIASVNGLVGTYSGIAGSSSKGGKAEGGDTPEPEPEPAE